jgi:hypothetical protein
MQFFAPPATYCLLGPTIFHSTLFSNTFFSTVSLIVLVVSDRKVIANDELGRLWKQERY